MRFTAYGEPTVPSGKEVVVMVGGGTCTRSNVLPLTPFSVAEIVVLPLETAVHRPPELIVATAVLEEVQVA